MYLADFNGLKICHFLEVSTTTVDVSRQTRGVWTWCFNAKCITSGDGNDLLSIYNCYVIKYLFSTEQSPLEADSHLAS
jgi:hypothetical protein